MDFWNFSSCNYFNPKEDNLECNYEYKYDNLVNLLNTNIS
jgi:hypothetical protein